MFRQFFRRTGFRFQLTVIVSAAILGLALFSSLVNSWGASTRMREYYIEQGQRLTENLARQSTTALLDHNPAEAGEAVTTTLTFPDVLSVHLTDAGQRVLLARVKAGGAALAAPAPRTSSAAGAIAQEAGEAWHFSAPIFGGSDEQPELLGHADRKSV